MQEVQNEKDYTFHFLTCEILLELPGQILRMLYHFPGLHLQSSDLYVYNYEH